jgi:phosphoglycerate dehydrogenase-like enzyme
MIPFLSEERAEKLGVQKVELDDLLARADFITCMCRKLSRPVIS